MVDPQQFIITRKRKKYRFALFANADNCYELDDWRPLKSKDLVIEIGAGSGLFLVELAKLHPENKFIAIDVKGDRLQKGATKALAEKVSNIFFVRARADQLLSVVQAGTAQTIWLTFSDPFPKKRDADKRLTSRRFIELYKNALVGKNAELLMKTDDKNLFDWSNDQLKLAGWQLAEKSYDLHNSNLASEFQIMTSYEQKWITQGRKICFLRARPPLKKAG